MGLADFSVSPSASPVLIDERRYELHNPVRLSPRYHSGARASLLFLLTTLLQLAALAAAPATAHAVDSGGSKTRILAFSAPAPFPETFDRPLSRAPGAAPAVATTRRQDAPHYSPEIGRFLSRDPAGFVDGLNLYSYVRNNPIIRVDPDGLNDHNPHYTAQHIDGTGGGRTEGFVPTYPGRLGGEWTTEDTDAVVSTVGFIPVVGDAVEAGYNLYKGDYLTATVSLVPYDKAAKFAGGAAKRLAKKLFGAGEELADAKRASSKIKTKDPVKPGDAADYGDLKDQKRKFGETEPLDMDHQPSFAAQKLAKEKELGRKLTPAEARELKANTPARASPRKVHQGEATPTVAATPRRRSKEMPPIWRERGHEMEPSSMMP